MNTLQMCDCPCHDDDAPDNGASHTEWQCACVFVFYITPAEVAQLDTMLDK
jgi:hypothetical protein